MREIKFEVLNIKNGKKEPFILNNDFDCHSGWLEDCVLRQYTGLKDKNSKEIYDGDIVLHNEEKIEVKYGCQEVDAFEGIGFNLWSFIGEYDKLNCSRLQSELEVIGNIYENKDLI